MKASPSLPHPQTHKPTTSPAPSPSPSHRAGFSLIEIMVATTILVIIVMMVAMVFQQSSLAWQGGIRRADGNMMVRSLIGMVQHEMSQAVDARAFGFENIFEAHRAEFVILSEQVDDNNIRAPRLIEYSYSGGILSRTETALRWNSGNWIKGETVNSGSLNSADQPLNGTDGFRIEVDSVWHGKAAAQRPLPDNVELSMRIDQEGSMSSVEIWSGGPDEEDDQGEDDDIRSW